MKKLAIIAAIAIIGICGLMLLYNEVKMMRMEITSPAFSNNGVLPGRYTCDGDNVSPPLHISGIPPGTATLALIMDDPDAPSGDWVHWIVWNIKPAKDIAEDSVPGIQGANSFKEFKYGGPCPPSGTHRYFFRVYALDIELGLPVFTDKAILEEAMKGHILAKGELVGKYSRS